MLTILTIILAVIGVIINTLFFFVFFSNLLEHGLHSTLSHPPIINNNNSSINNNNHSPKSGTNPAKLAAVAAAAPTVNGDHHQQPSIASIHRNGRVSEAASAAKKAVAIPKVKSKSKSKTKSIDKTLTNGDLTENLIEFSIVDAIDGNQSSGDQSSALLSTTTTTTTSPIPDKTLRNSQPTPADLNVIQANKTIVALSILIQHLTTDVSFRVSYYFEMRINHFQSFVYACTAHTHSQRRVNASRFCV